MRFNTALLHGDFRGDKNTGATQTPIYQSSAFEHASAETLEKIWHLDFHTVELAIQQ